MSSNIDYRRLLKNSLMLYVRMFVLMAISLFTVRIVLDQLGAEDYGIYNVVASVVSLCSFLSSSLSSASQRFFAREFVKEGRGKLRQVFSLNVWIFLLLFVVLVVVLETAGLWYLNNRMVFPAERMNEVNLLYQFSILSLASSFIIVPYSALIVTHERMGAYAYISILEGALNLAVAYLLATSDSNKLVLYGGLMLVKSILVTASYVIYCNHKFAESHLVRCWDKGLAREILSFSSLHFFGSFSYVIKTSGNNVVLNLFFSTVVNAARGIAISVDSVVSRITESFFAASKPQLYKSYANKEYNQLNTLINRSTIICAFLSTLCALPIALNIDFLLSLWLKETPPLSGIFVQLIMIDTILNLMGNSVILIILASGRQKCYQFWEFTLRVATLPLAYCCFLAGLPAYFSCIACVVMSLAATFARPILLKRVFGDFEIGRFIAITCKIIAIQALIFLLLYFGFSQTHQGFLPTLVSSLAASLLLSLLFFAFVIERADSQRILSFVKSKINR